MNLSHVEAMVNDRVCVMEVSLVDGVKETGNVSVVVWESVHRVCYRDSWKCTYL